MICNTTNILYQSTTTQQSYDLKETEALFCIAGFCIAALVIIVSVYSRLKCHSHERWKYKRSKSKIILLLYNIFSRDSDNRAIITIKFGLLCVKPFLILVTKDKIQAIVYYMLQFCSLLVISYLTYTKVYPQKVTVFLFSIF